MIRKKRERQQQPEYVITCVDGPVMSMLEVTLRCEEILKEPEHAIHTRQTA